MVNIRIGNINDVPNIAELLIHTWQISYQSFIPADFLESLNLERQIQRHTSYMNGRAKYFIAENTSNEMIGFVSFGANRIATINSTYELYSLYVHHNYQGTGIGQMLLDTVLADLKNEPAQISVSVFQNNPFKEFYIKNDFVHIDVEIINMGKFDLNGEIYSRTTK